MFEDSIYFLRVLVDGEIDVKAKRFATLREIMVRTALYEDEQHILDAVEKRYRKNYTGRNAEFQMCHRSDAREEEPIVVGPVLYRSTFKEMGIDAHNIEPEKALNYISALPQSEESHGKLRNAQMYLLAIKNFLSEDELVRLSDTLTLQDLEEMGLAHLYEEIKGNKKR